LARRADPKDKDRPVLSKQAIQLREEMIVSRVSTTQPLMASVLDRLIDPASDDVIGHSQLLRELKLSVRRDLENLLNTRWRCKIWPPDLGELEKSLVNYGIPDFTGANLGVRANREEFRKIIERTIRRCEPRFKRVTVALTDKTEPDDRMLRFRIDALLHADPAPEPVVFESTLLPATAHFEVRRAGR
jgi:type VI secretion system protein ImpF